jgi:hypothetical protein
MQSCPVPPQWKRPFPDRLLAALRLDKTVFEEVENDKDAMGQAAAVIFLASLAQGLGGIQAQSIPALLGALVGLVIVGFLGWLVSTGVIWLIGVKLMGCTSDYAELLRTMGFASAPKILFLIGVLPIGRLGYGLGFLVMFMTIAAAVLAIRHALDVSTGRAVLVCILAVIASVLLAATFATLAGLTAGTMS